MGVCVGFTSVSDENIAQMLEQPALIWQLLAPDEPAIYESERLAVPTPGFWGRLFGKKPAPAPSPKQLILREGEGLEESVDKAWQAIHFCLNGTEEEAEPPMDFLMDGGVPVGDVDVGLGPARVYTADQVADIVQTLSQLTDDDFLAGFKPEAMDDIYPGSIWRENIEDNKEYLLSNYNEMRQFLQTCAKHKLGMAVYCC